MKSIVVFCVLLVLAGCGRHKSDVVAEVGGQEITVDAFKQRYQQFLSQGSKRDNILLREEILNNMINERLIYLDAARQGFDSDADYQRRMKIVETQALLDRYSLAISFDTMKITETELRREFRSFITKASARYLYAKTEEGARRLKQRLAKGETFRQIAKEVFEDPGLANNGGYLGVFGWGEMEPALEETAFTIPVGSISDPVKLNIGYAIVKVETRVQQPLVSEYDYAKVIQKLADKIQEKKILHLTRKDAEETSKGLGASFNDQAVNEVFTNWSSLRGKSLVDLESGSVLPQNISSMKLMDFSRGSWTVKDFVGKVEWTAERQQARVKEPQDVKDMAIGLATREVFLERAKAMGLEGDSTVQSHVKNLRERYLLKRWGDSVLDTVGKSGWSAAVMDSMYRENKQQYAFPPEVNVAEILVRSEFEAKTLLAQINAGANFGSLARKKSIRLWAAKNSGELGFGTQATFGPLGAKFVNASVGQIIGPEHVDPYWGIFKILDKREGKLKTQEEAREEIVAQLLPLRKQETSRYAIDRLRNQSEVIINKKVLEEIAIQSDNQAMR